MGTARWPLRPLAHSVSPLCALGMLSRHGPAAPPVPPRLRAGVCGMLDQRCSPALTPGDGNVILPGSLTPSVCNGYPSAHTAPLRAPQGGASAEILHHSRAQVPICIQSPFPWHRGDAPTASMHCWVISSPLLSVLSWSIPAHPILSQLPTHQAKRLRSF